MLRIALASVLFAAGTAAAATIVVPPGPGTPIQDAIDAASPGDTIRLTLGGYPEQIVVTKRLKIRGVRSTSTTIGGTTHLAGSCGPGPMITIAADDVQIRSLAIFGSNYEGVSVVGRARVKVRDVFVASNCSALPLAPAFDVDGSTRVSLEKIWASGPIPAAGIAGVRIANTPQEGRVRVRGAIVGRYERGILLENNGILAVRVSAGDVNFNDRGIVLAGTSRAIVDRNELVDNAVSGIEADATSSGNTFVRNVVSGSAADVSDAGTGNCWRNNVYQTGTVPPCP